MRAPLLALAPLLSLHATTAGAVPLELVDANSIVAIEDGAVTGWTVSGIAHLRSQSLWLRVGDAGPERPLADLSVGPALLSDADGDGHADTLAAAYRDGDLAVALRWTLVGGPLAPPTAGATSSLVLQLDVQNTGDRTRDLHLFHYVDVDLFGSFADDRLALSPADGANTARVADSSGLGLYEAVLTPAAAEVEAALFDLSLAHLSDDAPSALDGSLSAEGDVTWTAAWSRPLAPGAALSLGIAQRIEVAAVPEPGAACLLALLGAGSAGVAGLRRRHAP